MSSWRFCIVFGALLSVGCGKLLDADRFHVTSAADPCAPLGVLRDGKCQSVGVSDCGASFEADTWGGCRPIQQTVDCAAGLFAPPTVRDCVTIGPLACGDERFGPVGDPFGQVLYVDPDAARGGDGTQAHPLRSIAEAVGAVEGKLTIVLSSGAHAGGVDLTGRTAPLRLLGSCAQRTTIQGTAGQPALALGPGASGSSIESLAITGGSVGLTASGVDGLKLDGVWIHDVDGPGLSFDDASGPSSVSLTRVMVEQVVDTGIAAHGTDLKVDGSVVTHILPANVGSRALGIDVEASAVFAGPDPGIRTPGQLALSSSLIANTVGAGLRAVESTVSVKASWIRDVEADGLGLSRGIDVRGSPSQTLNTELTVDGSLIERAHEAGIQSVGADLTLTDSTLRDIGSSANDACRGAGLSAVFPIHFPLDEPPKVSVRGGSVHGVGRVGLELMGGAVDVSGVALSGDPQGPCPGATGIISGDAAADAAPTLHVAATRLDSFGVGISARRSTLEVVDDVVSCSAQPLTLAGASSSGSSVCGCAGTWEHCHAATIAVDDACVASGDKTCLSLCLGQITASTMAVQNAAVWLFDYPSVRSQRTGKDGCVELAGVPRGRPLSVAASAVGFGPGLAMAAPIDEPFAAPSFGSLIPLTTTALFSSLAGQVEPTTDTRLAALIAVRVCSSPRPLPTKQDPRQTLCDPLPGVKVALSPSQASPLYFDAANVPNRNLTETEGADVAFPRVEPGAERLRIMPPAGKGLSCAPNRWGWATDERSEFTLYSEPGFTEWAAELVCQLSDLP